ncbi:MAG: nickel pincer cofactor biosynthesis protein LarC [Deltaproteobacteria bacterium]|nr:nickel pincer cofactor biosynthesis protein LarC [Deltaproteobacteria bacterium]
MRTAYFDLISGISGDMTVAALLDLGVPRKRLQEELGKLANLEFRMRVGKKAVNGIRAVRFQVLAAQGQPRRSWADIRALIERSGLSAEVKARGLAIFSRLAEAEGKIHGVAPEEVHFHEVGAVDSIVDIVAAAIGTCFLGIDEFACSAVPLGRGLTRSLHGVLPVPAPATLELLKGFPVEGAHIEAENVTPTGAAILSALVTEKGEAPAMRVERTGYGAGTLEFADRPNVLRMVLGESASRLGHERMLVMETHIDDMNPEFYDYVLERLFAEGARDVTLSPVQMKKNRPGTLLRVVAEPEQRDALAGIVLGETSTLGVRCYLVDRLVLPRRTLKLKTRFGTLTVKVAEEPGGGKRATPEYDQARKVAVSRKVPLKAVYDEVTRCFMGGQ